MSDPSGKGDLPLYRPGSGPGGSGSVGSAGLPPPPGEDPLSGLATRAVWAGEPTNPPAGSTVLPVFLGVTFAHHDLDEWRAVAVGDRPGHIYSRTANPSVELFERKVAALEGAEAALGFATGMGAISSTLYTILEPGARVVSIRDTYGGTSRLFTEYLPRWDVEVALADTSDHEAIEAAIDEGCDLLYLESPTNPTLRILDMERLASRARDVGAVVVVDNTFATPINQRPLELGADLVVHSATKFLGGHSDAMGGVVAGSSADIEPIFRYREIHGASLDPHAAFLLARGVRTLELRVSRQNDNALAVARFLADHPAVAAVHYPGLPEHPHHDVARRQMSGFGGVLSFELEGGEEAMRGLLAGLRLAHRAASLGSVATLVGPPAMTSHVELTPEQRAEAGIPESLVRYAVGIETVDDLIADLRAALEQAVP
jgi:cystathionine gamma-synthase